MRACVCVCVCVCVGGGGGGGERESEPPHALVSSNVDLSDAHMEGVLARAPETFPHTDLTTPQMTSLAMEYFSVKCSRSRV